MRTKVYYADTDAGGVVYYANYLRWLEIARTDWLEQHGTPIAAYADQGVLFAVVRAEIDYLKPAVLGDEIEVTVQPVHLRRVRFTLSQDATSLCRQRQTRVDPDHDRLLLTPDGRITAIPERLGRFTVQDYGCSTRK